MHHQSRWLPVVTALLSVAMPLICADQPAFQPVPGRSAGAPPTMMPRATPGLEVELLVIEPSNQSQSLARWAVLAAEGYRLSQVSVAGTIQYLYLERMAMSQSTQMLPALPAQVEGDPALAAETRAKVMAAMEARRPRQAPGEPPIGRITPVLPGTQPSATPAATTGAPAKP